MAGWFALYVEKTGGLYFEHWPMAGVYCAASKQGGPVDIVFRCYQLTAEQCVTDFKQRGDSLPPEIIDKRRRRRRPAEADLPRDVHRALRAHADRVGDVACNASTSSASRAITKCRSWSRAEEDPEQWIGVGATAESDFYRARIREPDAPVGLNDRRGRGADPRRRRGPRR
ncbi:portal protein [Burkholderia contaminans]|uniref:Uncharacterized protein n=1 Tax=Burkholderia contaminans TaxID=488447 RepID=A0A2S5DR58_9BURK|nr:portal protein [Burkholderia contaminans]POZ81581.1 hypothetical protein C3743_14720 [Burkholderia contaminans]